MKPDAHLTFLQAASDDGGLGAGLGDGDGVGHGEQGGLGDGLGEGLGVGLGDGEGLGLGVGDGLGAIGDVPKPSISAKALGLLEFVPSGLVYNQYRVFVSVLPSSTDVNVAILAAAPALSMVACAWYKMPNQPCPAFLE